MRKGKKIISFAVAFILCFGLIGCGLTENLSKGRTKELSDEEVVIALMEAYQQGNYEELKPYISDDNPLHLFFGGMDEAVGGEMAAAYKAMHEHLKDNITYTAEAVEGKEAWGTVNVTISMPDYSQALHSAMVDALTDQVENGSTAFYDMPKWMESALQGEGEMYEETFELHVGNRDGNNVMDTNTNRQFFAMLCGGLKPYLNATITTCTFPNEEGGWNILSMGDEITAIIDTELVPMDAEYTQEDLEATVQSFEESMNMMDGVIASATIQDQNILLTIGVDMENASTYALSNMGLISDRITAGSNGWISLDSTISAFTREGGECITKSYKNEE